MDIPRKNSIEQSIVQQIYDRGPVEMDRFHKLANFNSRKTADNKLDDMIFKGHVVIEDEEVCLSREMRKYLDDLTSTTPKYKGLIVQPPYHPPFKELKGYTDSLYRNCRLPRQETHFVSFATKVKEPA